MDYDLRQLRYFVTIAEAGSFSKAALQLGVAQSALSHHISQMEARLGVALFSRSSKGVEKTESGTRFLDHARAILAAVDAATNDVRDDAKEPGGLVRLGATLTVAPMLVEPLMDRLSKVAPRISLRIEERLSPPLVQAVASGELDIAVCFNAGEDRRIDGIPVLEEEICLVGVPELVGDTEDPIRFEDALSFPLLLPGRDHILRGMIDRVALFRNRPIEVRHECLSLNSLLAGLRLGLGATLISRLSALPLTRSGEVLCRPINDPVVSRQLFIASSSERPKTTAQKTVVRTVQDLILEKLASGDLPGAKATPSSS
ncbi:LysR family transcriptional regulator [Ruegeria sp. HKCCD8929]|uniref:LysR family transcriptional regulator n=1 Tax=Ruegeria sp. HKCCD8929 TaxID=2683006 RepID=UPI001488C871|nr:LysR family transcriptional regulator [Ruegeria sp. HKCCD8929]